mgnify:CR=1 FL=1
MILKDAVPLLSVIAGLVQPPDAIVGAVFVNVGPLPVYKDRAVVEG